MPKNYRVLKQAFGRTSREGKKGTGQIILKNVGYNSYTDVVKEMNDNEKEEIQAIQKRLRILCLFLGLYSAIEILLIQF